MRALIALVLVLSGCVLPAETVELQYKRCPDLILCLTEGGMDIDCRSKVIEHCLKCPVLPETLPAR